MSAGVTMAVGGPDIISYTVVHRGSCALIVGEVPAKAFGVLAQLAPEDSVMSADVARMYGATFAFGPADELQALRVAAAGAETTKVLNSHPGLSQDAAIWLASGERGMSSEALFTRLSGVNCVDGCHDGRAKKAHPYDVDDFRRCRLMLEACPELETRLSDAADLSPQWAALIAVWRTLCDTMDAETPNWRDRNPSDDKYANTTYSIIKQAIGR